MSVATHSVQLMGTGMGTSAPLHEVTFCVVDLETTGDSADLGAQIIEIGAVKVHGGEVVSEFQTLVNPHTEIPAFITVLTGISNAIVAQAPAISTALTTFLEFAQGCVLVAHNAPFDIGFLQHNALILDHPWPHFMVLDTVTLARELVSREESPNYKLASLARLFATGTTPDHRALNDARATAEVFHCLIARLSSLSVQTLGELVELRSVLDTRRDKRTSPHSAPQPTRP